MTSPWASAIFLSLSDCRVGQIRETHPRYGANPQQGRAGPSSLHRLDGCCGVFESNPSWLNGGR